MKNNPGAYIVPEFPPPLGGGNEIKGGEGFKRKGKERREGEKGKERGEGKMRKGSS